MNPIVIDPPGFDQHAAWGECKAFVEQCGGLAHQDGSVNWRAAFGADPGCCSCPACGKMYWAWGRVQECVRCHFRYPTDWWCMYSWGAQAGFSGKKPVYAFDDRIKHPYYRYGYEHPVEDPWEECHSESWRNTIRSAMTEAKEGADGK